MNQQFFPNKEPNENALIALPCYYLYGKRFYSDQPVIELLAEFLMLVYAEKKIDGKSFGSVFPNDVSLDIKSLKYNINHKLYFKLFSLWPTGKHPKESKFHAEEYKNLMQQLKKSIKCDDYAERHLEILSNLYQGFQVAGETRDWASRSFLPLSKNLITGETIWRASNAKKSDAEDFNGIKKFFSHTDRDFYARGGEILYLQLLALITKSKEDVKKWINDNDYSSIKVSEEEMDPNVLKARITEGFNRIYSSKTVPSGFDAFIDFVERKGFEHSAIDESTLDDGKESPFNYTEDMEAGFIPIDSWYLGYLFALDLSRLFSSQFDSIELIRLLEIECTLQVFRTMAYQSSKYLDKSKPLFAVVSENSGNQQLIAVSKRAFDSILKRIKDSFDLIVEKDRLAEMSCSDKKFNESDMHKKYGYAMLRKHLKEINVVVPKKGGNEHFVLTKNMLILLISTTLSAGEALTLESFLNDLKIRWGFVFDSEGFTEVNKQENIKQMVSDPSIMDWLVDMLKECGYYIALSDAISLVKNNNISVEKK